MLKTVLGAFAMLAVAASLLTANPASAQDKMKDDKKPAGKMAPKKGAKPAGKMAPKKGAKPAGKMAPKKGAKPAGKMADHGKMEDKKK